MAGSVFQRAQFMVGLLLTVAKRALPQRAPKATTTDIDPEPLIEALQTGDLTALAAYGPSLATATDSRGSPLFFLALETGSLSAVQWFLNQGASPTAPDRAGRLPLETVIQRAAIADEFDDHLDACPAMLTGLMAAGADAKARNLQGAPLADLARAAGLSLPQ